MREHLAGFFLPTFYGLTARETADLKPRGSHRPEMALFAKDDRQKSSLAAHPFHVFRCAGSLPAMAGKQGPQGRGIVRGSGYLSPTVTERYSPLPSVTASRMIYA